MVGVRRADARRRQPSDNVAVNERVAETEPRRWWSPAAMVDVVAVVVLTALALVAFRDRALLNETLVVVVLPLLARRRWPIPVLAVTALGALLTRSSVDVVDILAVGLAAYTVGDLEANRTRSATSALLTAFGLSVGFVAQFENVALSLVLPFVVILPTWMLGTLVRGFRVEAQAREAARRQALEAREAALRAAIADQRRTIARELHDVVAHAVSVMVIQAGAARSVLRTSPHDAEQSLLAVESTGREAMAELRRLLDVLADDGDRGGGAIAPQAGLAQLESLVARVREAGLPAELHVGGSPRPLPAGMDVTLYRIVQEALTNALRYAGRARTEIRVDFAPAEIQIEILDEGPGAMGSVDPASDTTKRGLVGMQERAAVFGGRVEAGPREGRGYAVRAWLPTGPSTT
jgi:signal transduction histidine kinase